MVMKLKENKFVIKNIKVNAILNVIYTLVNMLFPLLTYPYISRILGATNLGKVNFFISVANYAILFASLGLNTYGIRAIAKVRDDKMKLAKTTKELITLNMYITIVVMIIYISLAVLVSKFRSNVPLVVINGIWIITTPLGMNWLYSGLEQYTYITKRTVFFKIVSLILIFVFVRTSSDYTNYAAILVFANVGAYFLNYLNANRIVPKYYKRDLEYKKHLKPTLILFASALAISVYTNLDMIMLGFIRGDKQVGLYTVAVKAQTVLLSIVNALSTVLLPRLSFYISQKRIKEFNRILRKSIAVILLLTISLSAFFIIVAPECIAILGGKGYEGAILSMQILMPILVISGFSNITGNQILIPQGKDVAFMKAVISGAVVAFLCNLILMEKYGAVGGSIATLIAEMTQMSIQVYYSWKVVHNNFSYQTVIKAVIATVIAVAVTILCNTILKIGAFGKIIMDGIIYYFCYILILKLLKEEYFLELVNKILRRKKYGQRKNL